MRSSVSAVLIAGVAAQIGAPSAGTSFTTTSFGSAPSSTTFSTTSARPATSVSFSSTVPTASSGTTATTRGLPIGTVNGIQDSDVVCAQNGYTGSACGLQNVASIYNPNPNMRYQTQYSDNAISLLQSTNRYNAAGQRIINPATGNPVTDLGTYDIPTQNAIASGVTTTLTNGPAIQSTTNWLNNGALANYIAPSASNAVLPNSVAYQQANLAPWSTTPVNTLTGAGFGYSTLQGLTAGSVKAPVPATTTLSSSFGTGFPYQTASSFPASFSSLPSASFFPSTTTSSYFPSSTSSFFPSTTSSYFPATSSSYFPATSSSYFPATSSSYFPASSSFLPASTGYFPATTSSYFPTTTSSYFPSTGFGTSPSYQLPSFQTNPAAQPFTNAYSRPGTVGPPSQAGIVPRF